MKPKHLAWPALLQAIWQTGKNVVLVVIVGGLLLSKLGLTAIMVRYDFIILLTIAVVMLALAVAKYWRFTYVVEPSGIMIKRGLFVRQVTHIPYDKIQTVQHQQSFLLRPFHLERLVIETAGKTDKQGEGQLVAVPLQVGQQIESYRRGDAEAPTQPTATDVRTNPSVQINSNELNIYALSSLGIVPIILVLGWVYDKLHKLVPEQEFNQVEHQLVLLRGGLLIGIILAILLVGFLASYLNVIQRYYHFTLTRDQQILTMTRGYFQRNQVNVHSDRIQSIRLKQNVLRQWLHLTTVQAMTAGQAGEDEDDKLLTLLPVVKTTAAYAILSPFVGWLPSQAPTMTHVNAKARWYFIRNSLLLWLVTILLVAGLLQWWLPQFLALFLWTVPVWLIVAFFQGRYAANSAAVAVISPQLLALQTGSIFTREQVVVPKNKVQTVEVTQSIWMKKSQLAHLEIKIRSGNRGETIEVRYLNVATVRQIQAWYLPEHG